MTTIEAGPVKLPLAGGAYLRFFPPAFFRWGFRRLIETGEPIVRKQWDGLLLTLTIRRRCARMVGDRQPFRE